MRKINEIFFAGENEKGLTSSSANHLANMSTELIAQSASTLEEVKFIDTEIAIIGHQDRILSGKGITPERFNRITELIIRHGKLKSFNAWIREAIKAKEVEIKDAESYSKATWISDFGIEIPKLPELPKDTDSPELEQYPDKPEKPTEPVTPVKVTEIDVLETWSVKDRARYWEVEAMAATYGRLIHKDGSINTARDQLHSKVASPIEAEGTGRETIVKYYSPSIPVEEVDNLFNSLQNEYRSLERELNSMKYRIREEMEKLTQERERQYRELVVLYELEVNNWNEAMNDWRKEKDAIDLRNESLIQQWNSEIAKIREERETIKATHKAALMKIDSEFNSYKSDLRNKASKLKIRIPESLLGIFHELDSLGK